MLEKSVVIRHMQQELNTAGITCEDVRSEDFSFHSTGNVRISTLHSCKGLDFPVVLLYLPYLHRRAFYADRETEQLLRNLLFVGITRAMDNLNIFMRKTTTRSSGIFEAVLRKNIPRGIRITRSP